MSPASPKKSTEPTWDDVREEASALTREVMHQSIIWTHRAFTMATHMAEMTAKATEEAVGKAGETLDKVRRR
jgi:predicted translin family RNA/ssDNA-binding protein